MQSKRRSIDLVGLPGTGLNGPQLPPKRAQTTLRDIVREALLGILADPEASAAAKASAGRTLMQYFSEDNQGLKGKRGADMSAAELDAAIAELE
jgi:hypothetical protein